MHPLIRRYFDFPTAVDALKGLADDADAQALGRAGEHYPDLKDTVLVHAGRKRPSSEATEALNALCAYAAALRLDDDPRLGELTRQTRAALEPLLGAEEVTAALADVLIEDAFGTDADPAVFDAAAIEETLRALPRLAAMSEDDVLGLVDAFAKQAPAEQKELAQVVAATVFESAWSLGVVPVNAEHLREARSALEDQLTPADFERVPPHLRTLIAFLRERDVLGPLRVERLTRELA